MTRRNSRLIVVFLIWLAVHQGSESMAQNNKDSQPTGATIQSKNPDANKDFLEAEEYLGKSDPRTGGTLSNARRAIALYENAVKKDPTFALAYVQLSRAWLRLGYSDPDGLSNDKLLPPAKAALLKALALNKNLKEAHAVLAALYYNIDYDWQRAEYEYQFVLKLDSGSATAHASYAAYLSSMGRFDEALTEINKAEELQSSLMTELTAARIYYSMRRYDLAIAYCKRSLTRQDNVLGHFYLGFIHVAQNEFADAITEFKTAAGFTRNGGALAGLAYGYAMAGRKDEALDIIKRLNTSHNEGLLVPYRIAAVYVALHDNDHAFEWLRRDYKERGRELDESIEG